MGTVFSFDLRDASVEPDALDAAVALLHAVDATFSTYRDDSVVSRLSRSEIRLADCPADVREVLDLCADVRRTSLGYFTATAGGRLEPSGLVKGWAVERAAELLRSAGSSAHCVNGGGDLQLVGSPSAGRPWRIGVAHPFRPGDLATVVTGRDFAVATSGTAERGAHVVDPHTGRPATALASVTLVGRQLTFVDAYATAACAMGDTAREWVEQLDGYEAFAVTSGGRCWWTSGYPAFGTVDAATAA
jgi:thiamine biosynthesis lipoprotein